MSLIEITNLSKSYLGADTVVALDNIDLEIQRGSFVGMMGPSGSGKSTFLSIIGGLCQPGSGRVMVNAIDLYGLGSEDLADFRREYLGFVFQAFNLIPYLTALENVMLPLAVKSLPGREKRRRAQEVLERVGLSRRIDHLPSQLSGGEQERVAIARALINRPPLILADEPTGSLDSATSSDIMALLAELHREGQTIVMVTHNLETCPHFDRTILLRDGRIASDQLRLPLCAA